MLQDRSKLVDYEFADETPRSNEAKARTINKLSKKI